MTDYPNDIIKLNNEIPPELINDCFQNNRLSTNPVNEILPYDIEAEENLLRLILFGKGEVLNLIKNKLAYHYFYLSLHAQIYQFFLKIYAERREISIYTLTKAYSEQYPENSSEFQNFQEKLAILANSYVASSDYEMFVDVIRDSYLRRQTIEVANQIKHLASNKQRKTEDILDFLNNAAYTLNQLLTNDNNNSAYLEEIYPEVINRAIVGKKDRILTGVQEIDNRTNGGFVKDDLIVIAGQTSMGKTQVLVDLAFRHWQIHKLPVVFLSCELSKDQISERFLYREIGEQGMSHIDATNFNPSQVTPEEWNKISTFCQTAGKIKIYEFDGDVSLIPLILSEIQIENNGKIGMVVIDYIQKLSLGDINQLGTRNRELEIISDRLKRYAQKFKTPFVIASQLSRNVSNRNDKRPLMSDIRDSGTIEQSADQIWMLYRDEYYDPMSVDQGILEINLAKLRNGGTTGTLKVLLDKAHFWMKDLSTNAYPVIKKYEGENIDFEEF